MIGVAAILASAVALAVAVPVAMGAEYLTPVPEAVQMLAIAGALVGYVSVWWGAFNLACHLMGVPK